MNKKDATLIRDARIQMKQLSKKLDKIFSMVARNDSGLTTAFYKIEKLEKKMHEQEVKK